MLQARWRLLAVFSVFAIILGVGGGRSQEPKSAAKDDKKNPLQALQDAFNKGVTVTPIEAKDLPKEIADAAAKKSPGATIEKAKKQEIRHTLKYVAFDKPRVQSYQVVVAKDEKKVRVQVAPDGKKLGARPVEAAKDKIEAKKEIDIPEAAKKSVKAIKDLYPDAVVEEITTEVYQDPSGTVDILTYEIEFITKGTKREMVASPEGVIPHLWAPVAEKDLPKAVAETAAKELPEGKIESASRYELRAGLQFAPLEKARVVYQLEMKKDDTTTKLAFRADGTLVPAPVRPGGNRAFLGVQFEKGSTVVSQVTDNGPASQAGIQRGDKLLAVGDTKVGAVPDLLRVLQSLRPGTEVPVQIQRGEKNLTVRVKLGSPPS
jgi:hypothetical protein